MGNIFAIKCTNCGYKREFYIGIGMMYSPDRVISDDLETGLLQQLIKSKKTQAFVKNLLHEKAGMMRDDYGHVLYRCNRCGEFYDRFFYHIDYIEGSFEPEFKCPKCKKLLNEFESKEDEVKIALPKYPCPKCGKKSLQKDIESMGCWD